jgi:hypothetical protein
MIDARDQLGVPVITDCPLFVRYDGVTYEVAADALVVRLGDITFSKAFFDDAHSWFPRFTVPVLTPTSFAFTSVVGA